MSKMWFSISVVTAAFLVFAILCGAENTLPLGGLLVYLLLLNIGLVWMVITILKDKKEPTHTFDQKFYNDADLGPGKQRTIIIKK
jgi:archaellum biogenesis protein FlaJ (TadC family)